MTYFMEDPEPKDVIFLQQVLKEKDSCEDRVHVELLRRVHRSQTFRASDPVTTKRRRFLHLLFISSGLVPYPYIRLSSYNTVENKATMECISNSNEENQQNLLLSLTD